MKEGIYIDRSSGAAYRVERMGEGLIFQASKKMSQQFIDPQYLPQKLERVPEPLSTKLGKLMEIIEDFYSEISE